MLPSSVKSQPSWTELAPLFLSNHPTNHPSTQKSIRVSLYCSEIYLISTYSTLNRKTTSNMKMTSNMKTTSNINRSSDYKIISNEKTNWLINTNSNIKMTSNMKTTLNCHDLKFEWQQLTLYLIVRGSPKGAKLLGVLIYVIYLCIVKLLQLANPTQLQLVWVGVLSNSTPTCKPNSTSVGLSRSWLCFPKEGRRITHT